MKTYPVNPGAVVLAVAFGLLAPTAAVAVEGVEGITAVASRVSKDYIRTRLHDGSFQAEAYAFGDGGYYGGPIHDYTIDKLKFLDVVRSIAVPLAGQNYISSKDPKGTKLLIMVYWGTTTGTSDSSGSLEYQMAQDSQYLLPGFRQPLSLHKGEGGGSQTMDPDMVVMIVMENKMREMADARNTYLLGYDCDPSMSENVFGGFAIKHNALTWRRNDLVSEIEYNRYFVVLMAYDFQLLWKEKKQKLLWETRFSINQLRNDFTKALPVMAQYASRYFGQDSHGLLRTQVPEGNVEVGEPTFIELLDARKR